ncbi:MAG: prepilin peptidase, partial [Nitrososphaerota archaeon]
MIEYLRIALASVTLLYTSYLDLKTREVDDHIWVIASVIGAVANLYAFLTLTPSTLYIYGLAVGSTAGVAFALYWLGLYGGADAKALTCLAIIHPTVEYGIQLHRITGLTTFTNGMFLSSSLPLTLGFYNIYRIV